MIDHYQHALLSTFQMRLGSHRRHVRLVQRSITAPTILHFSLQTQISQRLSRICPYPDALPRTTAEACKSATPTDNYDK